MRYSSYSVQDFLKDEDFKRWVKSPDTESDFFWHSFIAANPDKRNDINKARAIIQQIIFDLPQGEQLYSESEKDEIWNNILDPRQMALDTKPRHFKMTSSFLYRVAAIIIIPLLITMIFLGGDDPQSVSNEGNKMIVKNVPKGQKLTIQLPDGSSVTINSNSSLSYAGDFETNRLVELSGEAFFQVKKDPKYPFRVKSGLIQTTALGTTFNINTDGDSFKVLLVEGKVQVMTLADSTNTHILLPKREITYTLEEGFSPVVSNQHLIGIEWTKGIILFNDTPLTEVLETLENWYGVDFIVDGKISDLSYSGRFEDEYLSNVLHAMSFSLKMKYELKNKTVYLKMDRQ